MENKDNKEKIVSKVKKILELSRNNPSVEEAEAAALKAQELMAQYHLNILDVDGVDADTIEETEVEVPKGKKWKYNLAHTVAKNFRCKVYYVGSHQIVFYGYSVDTEIAAQTFKYLFSVGNKAAASYYNKHRGYSGAGLTNSFLIGYLHGVSSVLDKQCTALMIVTPKEVADSYEEKTKNYSTVNGSITVITYQYRDCKEAERCGFETGKDTMSAKMIEQTA